MIAPLLAALWIGYHTPTVWVSFPLLLLVGYVLVDLPWWSILLQTLLAYGSVTLLYHGWVRRRNLLRTILKLPALEAPLVIDLLSSMVAALCFGLMYQAHRTHGSPILHYGMLVSAALLLGWFGLSHLARTLWFNQLDSAPWFWDQALMELTGWGVFVDCIVHSSTTEGRLILGALLGVRALSWVAHWFLFRDD
jgi:hypothetical protein